MVPLGATMFAFSLVGTLVWIIVLLLSAFVDCVSLTMPTPFIKSECRRLPAYFGRCIENVMGGMPIFRAGVRSGIPFATPQLRNSSSELAIFRRLVVSRLVVITDFAFKIARRMISRAAHAMFL